jgi:4-hydroxybenzoate polyprenyltransferase
LEWPASESCQRTAAPTAPPPTTTAPARSTRLLASILPEGAGRDRPARATTPRGDALRQNSGVRALPLFRAIRPEQWTKNLFVVAPLLFGKALSSPLSLRQTGVAFAAFCAASSSIYLLNDLFDREADRLHPVKRCRPIASGAVPVPAAAGLALALLAAAAAGAALWAAPALVPIALYVALMALYSGLLKHVALLDVLVIAGGFVLRVVAGSRAAGVAPSHWLLLCTFFLALYLALGKRRGELVLAGGSARPALEAVSVPLIESFESIAMAVTIVCYTLYTVAPETVSWFGNDRLLLTVPFVVFGLFRWRLLEARGGGEDPTGDLYRDPALVATILLWGGACAALIYAVPS